MATWPFSLTPSATSFGAAAVGVGLGTSYSYVKLAGGTVHQAAVGPKLSVLYSVSGTGLGIQAHVQGSLAFPFESGDKENTDNEATGMPKFGYGVTPGIALKYDISSGFGAFLGYDFNWALLGDFTQMGHQVTAGVSYGALQSASKGKSYKKGKKGKRGKKKKKKKN